MQHAMTPSLADTSRGRKPDGWNCGSSEVTLMATVAAATNLCMTHLLYQWVHRTLRRKDHDEDGLDLPVSFSLLFPSSHCVVLLSRDRGACCQALRLSQQKGRYHSLELGRTQPIKVMNMEFVSQATTHPDICPQENQ